MGNCFHESDTCRHSSLEINKLELQVKDSLCYSKKRAAASTSPIRSQLLSQSLRNQIIKEEEDNCSVMSPQIDQFISLDSNVNTLETQNNEGPQVQSGNKIKLQNTHTLHLLHSHHLRHQHNRLNEVSACQDCCNEHDQWSFEFLGSNTVQIKHPLTNRVIRCIKDGTKPIEVSCALSSTDLWVVEANNQIRVNSIIKLKHLESGLYLHTQPTESKVEGQHIVTLCQQELANDQWRIIEMH